MNGQFRDYQCRDDKDKDALYGPRAMFSYHTPPNSLRVKIFKKNPTQNSKRLRKTSHPIDKLARACMSRFSRFHKIHIHKMNK